MIKQILAFSAGLGLGIGGTYLYLNKKYHDRSNREIEEIREYYSSKKESAEEPTEERETITEDELMDYREIVTNNSYAESTSEPISKVVITPNEFGDCPGDDWDDPVTYTLYSDDVMVGYAGDVLTIEEIETLIGHDNLVHMGEYEPDVLYIRNYQTKTDYEILRDEDPYSAVYPTQAE